MPWFDFTYCPQQPFKSDGWKFKYQEKHYLSIFLNFFVLKIIFNQIETIINTLISRKVMRALYRSQNMSTLTTDISETTDPK